MVQKKEDKHSLVKEAVLDLNKGLVQLNQQKRDLERRLKGMDLSVVNARKQQQELQEKIAKLVEKEAKLNDQKKTLEGKENVLSDKLSKVKKIKYELEEV